MCIPNTIQDVDFSHTTLDQDEALEEAQRYVRRVMDEAWRIDMHWSQMHSSGSSFEHQRCAIRSLHKRFGDSMRFLTIPELRGTGHVAGERIARWGGGLASERKRNVSKNRDKPSPPCGPPVNDLRKVWRH